jgi:hypothetical protein
MYAGLDLRLGSHTGQGTRYGPKSVLVSDRRRTIDVSRKTHGVQFKVVRRQINYFLKLTQPSLISCYRRRSTRPRGHFNEIDGQQVNGQKLGASQRNRL